jgi:hypothetical protein
MTTINKSGAGLKQYWCPLSFLVISALVLLWHFASPGRFTPVVPDRELGERPNAEILDSSLAAPAALAWGYCQSASGGEVKCHKTGQYAGKYGYHQTGNHTPCQTACQ